VIISCRAFKYSSAIPDIYSWEAEMMRSDYFGAVEKKSRAIHSSLQHLSINANGANAFQK
jgi:hypothetical protein